MSDLKEIKDNTNGIAELKDKLLLDIKKDFELNDKIKKSIKESDKAAASKLNFCIRNTKNILDIMIKLQELEKTLNKHYKAVQLNESFDSTGLFDFED